MIQFEVAAVVVNSYDFQGYFVHVNVVSGSVCGWKTCTVRPPA